ncbi:MAG: RecQ family zinc-binding domain-containing protein, partial [Planctomycetota bacterium]
LRALLAMVEFAKDRSRPRRALLADHFGLPEPEEPRGCDNTEDANGWRADHLRPRAQGGGGGADGGAGRPARSEERAAGSGGPPADPDASAGAGGEARPDEHARHEWTRGDWVRVDGRHLGQVVRVEGEGRRVRLVVESVGDFRRRTVDPRRRRVERLEGS